MPKCKSSRSGLLREWVAADKNFSTDGKVIFCQACEKQVRVILLYKFTNFLFLVEQYCNNNQIIVFFKKIYPLHVAAVIGVCL